jgi:hypothetical protein
MKIRNTQVSIEKIHIFIYKIFYELQQECVFSNHYEGEDQDQT